MADERADTNVFRSAGYADPRLAQLYDLQNPWAADTEFYLRLANRLEAEKILDIGCGTGLLTCALAERGNRVVGLDPAAAMLDVARNRPGGEKVLWVEGDASRLGETAEAAGADLAIMTGHVSQHITDEGEWTATLAAIHDALRPGGRVAFESLNPLLRPWTSWTPQATRGTIEHPVAGRVETWGQDLEVEGDLVRFDEHHLFENTGEDLVAAGELRFRTREGLTRSLADAGFSVEEVLGDWDGRPADESSREMIFVASRR